jgi:hypothetical protein
MSDELKKALEEIVAVASGERQIADDDTEGMAWIDKRARAALAAQPQQGKLLTDAEWARLSAESRHKLNVAFAAQPQVTLTGQDVRNAMESSHGGTGGYHTETIARKLNILLVSPAPAPAPQGVPTSEPRDWRGIRWIDSIKAIDLAQEIAQHFGHDCKKCGENEDEESCEFAWVETKLSNFLYVICARVPTKVPAEPAPAHAMNDTMRPIETSAEPTIDRSVMFKLPKEEEANWVSYAEYHSMAQKADVLLRRVIELEDKPAEPAPSQPLADDNPQCLCSDLYENSEPGLCPKHGKQPPATEPAPTYEPLGYAVERGDLKAGWGISDETALGAFEVYRRVK